MTFSSWAAVPASQKHKNQNPTTNAKPYQVRTMVWSCTYEAPLKYQECGRGTNPKKLDCGFHRHAVVSVRYHECKQEIQRPKMPPKRETDQPEMFPACLRFGFSSSDWKKKVHSLIFL